MTTIKIDPVTRIEGHLDIEVSVETVGGIQQVIDAKSSATMFRGFEIILKDRDPRDATIYTQRICGVCPVSHAMASALNLESAFDVLPPDNGRILRNLVLGANFIMSHILHFYHLAALDYINTEGIVDISPWVPRYITVDMVGGGTAQVLVDHYVQALEMRRKAHQMGAIFGAKLPCTSTFVPGGCTEVVTATKKSGFSALLNELRAFIDDTYVPDVLAVAGLFPEYYTIGQGCGNLLAYGVFDLDAAGEAKLLSRGRYTNGQTYDDVDPALITEYVRHSWFTSKCDNLPPEEGETEPQIHKPGAYSWIKSPRYQDIVYETGPLARMWVNGDYTNGISVLDRTAARALECLKVADAMVEWLDDLVAGDPVYEYSAIPQSASGVGLTEAPRGALGHWMDISGSKISRYQVVTPTAWNASPRDDSGEPGPIEQALIGTPVKEVDQPIEVLRVVHSFDPCIACAVHLVTPEGQSLGQFRA
jgi:hydrogenase large subunit